MPPKSKSTKSVKPIAKKNAPRPVARKAPVKSKAAAKPGTPTSSVKRNVRKKKPTTLLQTVKDTVRTGLDKAGAAVKSITPDALLPRSAKSKRR